MTADLQEYTVFMPSKCSFGECSRTAGSEFKSHRPDHLFQGIPNPLGFLMDPQDRRDKRVCPVPPGTKSRSPHSGRPLCAGGVVAARPLPPPNGHAIALSGCVPLRRRNVSI